MRLSIIIPTLNESSHIKNLVNTIKTLDNTEKEILIVDGGSTDDTVAQVKKLAENSSNIRLVENPDKYVSQGFNRAFQLTRGQYISLIGAHSIYPKGYFSTCIQEIESGSCNVAGGRLVHKGDSNIGRAISYCMSSKFGVGDTEFRTMRKKMYVDSVAFAVYHRSVFESAGLLDEELIRNQDDEFHYRLNKAGFRILMLPDLEIIYFVRDSLAKLFSQYYQYGFYKPLVIKKVRSGMRVRHLIPSLFVLYLFTLPIAIFWLWWLIPIIIYTIGAFIYSFFNDAPLKIKMIMPLVFPVLHISYGIGFLAGIRKWLIFK
ncbi:MAG: glycosyltransferase family 2 protein [Saprospiraceae bacterium]|nr:glycosyltransferase family 2 protein [Saprospiraceae bacterium]